MNINNFIFTQDPTPVPNEWLWERIRNWRNEQLRKSDWTQLSDSSADKIAWATYRQSLRDLPVQNDDATKVLFPSEPA